MAMGTENCVTETASIDSHAIKAAAENEGGIVYHTHMPSITERETEVMRQMREETALVLQVS